MSYDGSLRFDTRMDTSGFQKDANKLGNFVKGLGVFEIIKKGLEMIASSIDGAVSRYDTLNRFPKIMEQMGYSADQADKAMNKLSDGIQGLPTTLDGIVANTKQLVIATGDLDTGVNSALALNNAFLASGATAEEASRGMIQYIQMLSNGKVDMVSWRTLNETMTYALQRTAESFGFAGASAKQDLYAALRDGVITFEEFNARIIQLNDGVGGFAEMAKTATGGIGTAMTNLKTRTVMGVTSIIEALDRGLSATRFKSIENIINTASTGIKNALQGVANVVEFIAKNLDILIPLVGTGAAAMLAYKAAVTGVTTVSKLMGVEIGKNITLSNLQAIVDAIKTKAKTAYTVATGNATVALALLTAQEGTAATVGALLTVKEAALAAVKGVLTGQIGLATAAQLIWNAAMAANPIGLIIAGIALLVAAIVVLVSWLGNSSAAYKKQKEEVKALSERQKELTSSIEESTAAHDENMSSIDASARAGQNLLATLKGMVDENGKLTSSHEDAQQAIADLNNAYEGLNLSYDEETKQLSSSVEEIENYINAKESLAKTSALDEHRVELANEQAQIEAQLAEIEARRQIIAEDDNLSQQEKERLYRELDRTTRKYEETQASLAQDIEANNAAIEASTDSMAQNTVNAFEAINGAVTSDGQNLKQLAKLYNTSTDQILADMQSQGISMQEWADRNAALYTEDGLNIQQLAAKWGMTTDQVEAYMDEWGMSLDEFSKEMDATHTSAGLNLEQLAAKWGVSTEEIRHQMALQNISMQEWSDQQDARTQDVINSFNEIPAKYEKTADEMINILKTNAERYSAWTENIATLSQTMSAEAIAELQKLGPEANSAIEEMIADPAKAAEFEESVRAVMSAGAEGAEIGANDPRYAGAGSEAGANVGEGMETSAEAEAAATQMVEGVAAAAEAAVASADFTGIGQKIAADIVAGVKEADMAGVAEAMSSGFDTGANKIKTTVSNLKTSVVNTLRSMGTEASNSQTSPLANMAATYQNGASRITNILTLMKNQAGATLRDMNTEGTNITRKMIDAMVGAVTSGATRMKSAAGNVKGKTLEGFSSLPTDAAAVVSNMMNGMYNKMSSMAQSLYNKANEIAQNIIRTLNDAFDIHSPSRVTGDIFKMVMMGAYNSLEKYAPLLFRSTEDIGQGVIDRMKLIPSEAGDEMVRRVRFTLEQEQSAVASRFVSGPAPPAVGGNTYVQHFEQTINSPVEQSAAEHTREAEDLQRQNKWQMP